ncbi:glycosyltransferase [Patescibacteria group bacterium]|nr:glycosyltransferase [Patescibacteria group bacterium]MBU1703019.1 glycosyltransferase [Patescibacteria group bacterium]MBU1954068.1 glycosyltransferase [Patescibacteria group bacterium]
MKKIFFYTDTPIYGGAERHMLLLAKNLNKDKFKVELICSGYKQLNEWCKNWKDAGFKVHRLKVAHKHDPRHHFQIKKILKTEKPDILHLHLWNPGGCRYAFSAVDKRSTKIVSTEHDPFPIQGLKKSIKKNCLEKTDHTVAVSDANKALLLKLYPQLKGKITTVHNGIDLNYYSNELLHFSTQHREKLREELFRADPQDFVILVVAELHPRKGLKYLIEAFARINTNIPKIKLVLVGEGPERKILEKLIKRLKIVNQVVLTGRRENIPQILKSANLFILPSVKEAFGIVLLEAMAAQLPIIATNTGGIPEIVENHKSGELVEPQNIDALAAKMEEVIRSNALMQKLAYMGHHRVKEFDAKVMAEKTEKIYDLVLK